MTERWDAVVVGAGHNGLTAAAYLARAGRSVLVLERRDQVGGACTLEEPWPGYSISPCAYLAGLLHPLVVEELALHRHGYELIPLNPDDPYITVPFSDGSAFTEWIDEERTVDGARPRGRPRLPRVHRADRAASATRCAPTGRTTCGSASRPRASRSRRAWTATRSRSRRCSRTATRRRSSASSPTASSTRSPARA